MPRIRLVELVFSAQFERGPDDLLGERIAPAIARRHLTQQPVTQIEGGDQHTIERHRVRQLHVDRQGQPDVLRALEVQLVLTDQLIDAGDEQLVFQRHKFVERQAHQRQTVPVMPQLRRGEAHVATERDQLRPIAGRHLLQDLADHPIDTRLDHALQLLGRRAKGLEHFAQPQRAERIAV